MSESLESILWSQNTSNNLGLQGAETRVVSEPQDCLKNSISGGNGRDKLCAMCKRSSYLNMQDIYGKSRSKYHFDIYRFNLRDCFIKKSKIYSLCHDTPDPPPPPRLWHFARYYLLFLQLNPICFERILHLVSMKIWLFLSFKNWFEMEIFRLLRPLTINKMKTFKFI